MNRLLFTLVVIAMLSTGCTATHASKLNSVSIGMTKQDVITTLGSPTSTSAKESVEYLNYHFRDAELPFSGNPYFVRITNGKVDAYGKLGDFDSTKAPEIKNTIDLNIKK